MRCEVCGERLDTGDRWLGRTEVLGCPNGCDPDDTAYCTAELDGVRCELAPEHAGQHLAYPADTPVEWS